jgi:hypothetical protein
MQMPSSRIYYDYTALLSQPTITNGVFIEKGTRQPDVTEGKMYCLMSFVLIGHNDQATGVFFFCLVLPSDSVLSE